MKASWNQAEFETLLTEFIVSCDEPFDHVESEAFQKLLRYVHAPACKELQIPGRTTVCRRIMKMGEDTIESTQKMFSVCISIELNMLK